MRLSMIWLGLAVLAACDGRLNVSGPFGVQTRPVNATCKAFARPSTNAITLQNMWPAVTFSAPVVITQPPGDKTHFYITEQGGSVYSIGADGSSTRQKVLDISDRVSSGGEAGLLGLATAPDFATSHKIYVNYTAPGTNPSPLQTHIAEFGSSDGGATFDKTTERILIRLDQPYSNHNGGNVLFGPDGFLYFGLGDGGSGGDPQNRAQNKDLLFGKMLRIDVSKKSAGKEYAIPPTNPFATSGGAPEVFAYGLRNPWRWSFDRLDQKLWVGDVGQNAWEEIDVVELGRNYGWPGREGTHCYRMGAECNNAEFVDPLAEHPHSESTAITGGYVYRGSAIPALVGRYIYGDFESGNMWSFPADGSKQTPERLLSNVGNISTFSEDADGELYLALYNDGSIRKLVAATGGSSDGAVPSLLSLTGCFDASAPATGLIPYGVNAPLWSDGAEKSRWMALPDGKTITINADGDFDFPTGTVLLKEFRLDGKRIETRLMVHHDDGVWAGYTYEWRDDGSDAQLLADTKTKAVGTATWTYPSRSDCLRCHTEAAGFSLGPELGQLNGDYAYPSGPANQLATLHHIDVLTLTKQPPDTIAYPPPTSTAPLQDRARAHLHANCSMCHRPGGPSPAAIDLRYQTAFGALTGCGATPSADNFAIATAQIIKPGNPAQSIVSLRLAATDTRRMPPLAVSIVDTASVNLINDWITSLTACP